MNKLHYAYLGIVSQFLNMLILWFKLTGLVDWPWWIVLHTMWFILFAFFVISCFDIIIWPLKNNFNKKLVISKPQKPTFVLKDCFSSNTRVLRYRYAARK